MQVDQLLLSTLLTIIGSGLGTTLVALIFKRKFDRELEQQKAILQRAGRLHERQVDALLALDRQLQEARIYAELILSPDALPDFEESNRRGFSNAVLGARETLFANRLLLPSEVVAACQAFLRTLFDSQLAISTTYRMTSDASERLALHRDSAANAVDKLSRMLQIIDGHAHRIIHG